MKKNIAPLFLLSVLTATAQIPDADAEKYPASLSQVPQELRYPVGKTITTDKDGNYVVDGTIRHLIGVQTCKVYDAKDCTPTPGYPDSLKWIYEKLLDFDTAQRIGFDSIAPYTSNGFIRKFAPRHRKAQLTASLLSTMKEWANNGLPLFVDFSAVPWDKGIFNSPDPELAKHRSPDALNTFHKTTINHWVPYNVYHPDARKIYRAYWEEGVREYKGKSPVLAYELFNEPGYDDPGPYNRRLFADWLRKTYRTPEEMNRVWKSAYPSFEAAAAFKLKTENPGLAVDWGKFMENGFADLCRYGAGVIRKQAPGAHVSVQPLGSGLYRRMTRSNINPYEINRHMDAIALPTGGGIPQGLPDTETPRTIDAPASSPEVGEGFLMRHYFRAIGEGKPILNGELYVGKTANSIRRSLWLDLLRGSNASYVFEWTKRAWDWRPRNEEGGKKCAEREPYQVLNPYNRVPLYEIMRTKQEIFRFRNYFMPRERGVRRKLAILVSYPTERRTEAVPNTAANEIVSYVSGLEFSHVPLDAILEEQLDGTREKRYSAILAVGVRNIYPQTARRLMDYVRQGGNLILAREFMNEDEYGHPVNWNKLLDFKVAEDRNAAVGTIVSKLGNPELLPGTIKGRNTRRITAAPGWNVLAESAGTPVLLSRQYGKGTFTVVTPEMQDFQSAALLLPLLKKFGIEPAAKIRRAEAGDLASNIELHTAKRNGNTLYFLMNHGAMPKLIRFSVPEKTRLFDLRSNRQLKMENGEAEIHLSGENYAILGTGSRSALEKEFGAFTQEPAGAAQNEYRKELADYRRREKEAAKGKFRFTPDPAQLRTIDIRRFCNRGFVDSVADDGKGGWTDQGHQNSLTGVPWGVTTLLGVPCDLIRFDMNNDRTCIVLASKSQKDALPATVKGIPVGGKTAKLYFFHTAAWIKGKKALTYRMNYASGRTVDADAICDVNIGNWWVGGGASKYIAFRNRENRGFYCMEWVNPYPEDDIISIDLISPNTEIVPIVIGISAENYVRRQTVKWDKLRSTGWGKTVVRNHNATTEARITENTDDWAGIEIRNADPKTIRFTPEQWKKGRLLFEVNGGRDRFNNPRGGQTVKVSLRSVVNSRYNSTGTVPLAPYLQQGRIDNNPESFQTAEIPLVRFGKPENLRNVISGIGFQFCGTGKHSGLVLRNFRFIFPE